MDIIHAVCMDETHGTYVGDECFDIHAMMMPIMVLMIILTTNDDTDDDTDDGGRGNLYTIKVLRG